MVLGGAAIADVWDQSPATMGTVINRAASASARKAGTGKSSSRSGRHARGARGGPDPKASCARSDPLCDLYNKGYSRALSDAMDCRTDAAELEAADFYAGTGPRRLSRTQRPIPHTDPSFERAWREPDHPTPAKRGLELPPRDASAEEECMALGREAHGGWGVNQLLMEQAFLPNDASGSLQGAGAFEPEQVRNSAVLEDDSLVDFYDSEADLDDGQQPGEHDLDAGIDGYEEREPLPRPPDATPMEQHRPAALPDQGPSMHVYLEVLLYVLSGLLLICAMEQFIQLGMRMRFSALP